MLRACYESEARHGRKDGQRLTSVPPDRECISKEPPHASNDVVFDNDHGGGFGSGQKNAGPEMQKGVTSQASFAHSCMVAEIKRGVVSDGELQA